MLCLAACVVEIDVQLLIWSCIEDLTGIHARILIEFAEVDTTLTAGHTGIGPVVSGRTVRIVI